MSSPVFFDLETSGTDPKSCDVLQIGAKWGSNVYSAYVMPTQPIPPEATNVNGIYLRNRLLFHKGLMVHATSPKNAWQGLLNFLRNCDDKVILVAHNGLQFDFKLLKREIQKLGLLGQFNSVIWGVTDFANILRSRMPSLRSSCKLTTVADQFGIYTGGAHEAFADCVMMELLCYKLSVSVIDFQRHAYALL